MNAGRAMHSILGRIAGRPYPGQGWSARMGREIGLWLGVAWVLLIGLAGPAIYYARATRLLLPSWSSAPHLWEPVVDALRDGVSLSLVAVAILLSLATGLITANRRRGAAWTLVTAAVLPVAIIAAVIAHRGGLGPASYVRYIGAEPYVVPWQYAVLGTDRPRRCASFVVHLSLPSFTPAFEVEERGWRVRFSGTLPGCGEIGDLDRVLTMWLGRLGALERSSAHGLELVRSADPASAEQHYGQTSVLYGRDAATGRVVRLIHCRTPEPEAAKFCEHNFTAEGYGYLIDYPGAMIANWRELERRAISLRASLKAN
jgi:hypothetical protein